MKRTNRTRTVMLAVAMIAGVVGTFSFDTTTAKPAEALAPYYDEGGRSGSILRLYRAYYLRAPDKGGFNYWMTQSRSGRDINNISAFFSESGEFKARYGHRTDRQFVDLVYRNVMSRPADTAGYSYWVGRINAGLGRGAVMAYFSDSQEYRAKTVTSVPAGYRAGSNAPTLLNMLTVAPEPARVGYDRALFRHWTDADRNGCDTRCEILASEKRADGTWYSHWDGAVTANPSSFDIDHVVSLAEAWDSGASTWDASRRERFANWEVNLIAVSASSNRSKSDRDAAGWKPPSTRSHCLYAEVTVTTKYVWALTVDNAEKQALRTMLSGCHANSSTTPTGGAPAAPAPKPPPAQSGCKTDGVYIAANGACVANYEKANGDVNCGDLPAAAKPVRVPNPANDPYGLDGNRDGIGCS